MIKLGSLLKGQSPEAMEAVAPTVEEEAAPAKQGPLVWNPDAGNDWTVSGFLPNPQYIPEEQDHEPKIRKCGRGGHPFLSTPFVIAGKTIFTPLFCDPCLTDIDRERGQWPDPEPKIFKLFSRGWLSKTAGPPINEPDKMPTNPTPPATVTAPTGHATHGPSSLRHKEICAHWRGDNSTNPVAEEGTDLHERLVTGKTDGLEPEPYNILVLVSNLFTALHREMGDGAVAMVERRVNVAGITWGTADLILINGTKAIIADAKFGRHEVEDASTNLQGISYAVGVFHEFNAVQEVEVVFAQPRCDMVSRHTFTRKDDYMNMRLRVAAAVAKAEDPDQPYNLIPSNCIYCGNKAKCPALNAAALITAQRSGEELVIPENLQPANITDPETMARALIVADVLEKWIGPTRERAREMIFEGETIPGYELGERNAPRKITDTGLAWLAVKDALDPDDFIACTGTVSITALEKAFAAKAPRGEKAQAKQALEDRLLNVDAIKQEGTILYLKKQKQQQQPQLATQ